jgi:hypothetical protein
LGGSHELSFYLSLLVAASAARFTLNYCIALLHLVHWRIQELDRRLVNAATERHLSSQKCRSCTTRHHASVLGMGWGGDALKGRTGLWDRPRAQGTKG